MSPPNFPDEHEEAPPRRPLTWQTKAIIAGIVLVMVVMAVLHMTHVVGA